MCALQIILLYCIVFLCELFAVFIRAIGLSHLLNADMLPLLFVKVLNNLCHWLLRKVIHICSVLQSPHSTSVIQFWIGFGFYEKYFLCNKFRK